MQIRNKWTQWKDYDRKDWSDCDSRYEIKDEHPPVTCIGMIPVDYGPVETSDCGPEREGESTLVNSLRP
jgi:hypothetical protein